MTTLKPISKEKFNKLTKAEKRVAIAKDVLARIDVNQLIPQGGAFCMMKKPIEGKSGECVPLQPIINVPTNQCEACAKGSLFISFVGISNDYKTYGEREHIGNEEIDSPEMKMLAKIFTKKQLALIETIFEGMYYNWNVKLSQKEIDKCDEYRSKALKKTTTEYDEYVIILTAICNDIIKNKGEFNI